MLLPPEWRVGTTDAFDAELDALSGAGTRPRTIVAGWMFYLARDPFRFSHGLTGADDDVRVVARIEAKEGAEYVAGVWVDRSHQHVVLTWIARVEAD